VGLQNLRWLLDFWMLRTTIILRLSHFTIAYVNDIADVYVCYILTPWSPNRLYFFLEVPLNRLSLVLWSCSFHTLSLGKLKILN
jgi:hypothetical protein